MNIKEKIAEGHIHFRAIVEIAGKPKDYVDNTLKAHVESIEKTKGLTMIKKDFEDALEKEGYFSAFAELEMLAKNVDSLLSFCFDFMPSSVEIIDPERMLVESNHLTSFINDLQARLHALNTGMIQIKEKNKFYIKNTAVLLRNFIMVLLTSNPMTIEQMKPFLGVREGDIEKVLEVLIKEKKIKKDKDKYIRI